MKNILKLSKKYRFKVIEDAAHATGALFNKKRIGSHGFAVCFSFHPVKSITTAEGGAVTTNVKKYYDDLKLNDQFREL